VEVRSKVQRLKRESTIRESVSPNGLVPAESPPVKIIVAKTEP
ncbi:FtsL-like putative cell division protein, partial [Robiginitalea sp.]